jgi:hypothetical protein
MRLVPLIAASLLAGAAFAQAAAGAPPAAAPASPPGIVVFDQPNFKGRSMTLAQPTPDLTALKFDNRVASLKISGNDWVLCEHRNYAGRCVRVQEKAADLNLLQLSGRVSSLYPVPAGAAAVAPLK